SRIGAPTRGEFNQFVPVAGKGEVEDQADYTIVEVLDFSGKAFARVKYQGFEAIGHWGTLISDVRWGLSALESGLRVARLKHLSDYVEADFFADVVLDQDQDRAAEGSLFLRMRRFLHLHGEVVGDISGNNGGQIAVHRAVSVGETNLAEHWE